MSNGSGIFLPLAKEPALARVTPSGSQLPISPTLSIPQEIIDLVVDELAGDREDLICRQTLYACALCSPSFRSRVIVHTYGRVGIIQRSSIDDMRRRFEGLLDILQKDPVIGSNVRELEISSTSVLFSVSFWIWEITAVPLVFNHLNFVQRLILKEKGERSISWTSMQPEMASSLLAIIKSSSIQSLELERFKDFPVGLIKRCKRLREISLTYVACPPEDQASASAITQEREVLLESVTIDSSPTTMASLLLMPDIFTHLRTLRMGLKSINDIRNIKFDEAQTLEELHLTFHTATLLPINAAEVPPEFDLGIVPSLRRMTVKCTIDFFVSRFPAVLCSLLNLRDAPSNLESLRVEIDWEDVPMGQELRLIEPHEDWNSIDSSLADGRYVALRSVDFALRFGLISWFPLNTPTIIENRIKFLMDNLFPKVRTCRRITFDISMHAHRNPRGFW